MGLINESCDSENINKFPFKDDCSLDKSVSLGEINSYEYNNLGLFSNNEFQLKDKSLLPLFTHNKPTSNPDQVNHLTNSFNDDCSLHNSFYLGKVNSNKYNRNNGILFNKEFQLKEKDSISLLTHNKPTSSTDQVIHLTDLNANKLNSKSLFVVEKENTEISKAKKESLPEFFPENEINNCFRKFDISNEMKSNLFLDESIKNKTIETIKKELITDDIKRCRERDKNITFRSDHSINRIINTLDNSLNKSINKFINTIYSKEEISKKIDELNVLKTKSEKDLTQVIKKINYKFRYNLKKKEDIIQLLEFNLNQYFAEQISPKYDTFKYHSNYNKLIIEKLLQDENNKDIFEFIFNNLKLGDFLDIFLYKKDLKDFNKKIKDNFIRFDKYIDKI